MGFGEGRGTAQSKWENFPSVITGNMEKTNTPALRHTRTLTASSWPVRPREMCECLLDAHSGVRSTTQNRQRWIYYGILPDTAGSEDHDLRSA